MESGLDVVMERRRRPPTYLRIGEKYTCQAATLAYAAHLLLQTGGDPAGVSPGVGDAAQGARLAMGDLCSVAPALSLDRADLPRRPPARDRSGFRAGDADVSLAAHI